MLRRSAPRLFQAAASLWLLPLLAAGCGSSASTDVSNLTAPTTTRCQPSVTSSSTTFDAAGGTGTLAVAVARECSWNAASQAAWITITSGSSGQGDGTVAYRIAENSDPVLRQGTLAVADVKLAVSQQPAPCRYEVAPGQDAIPGTGGTAPIEVRAHPACAWTATADVPWADITPRSGSGSATLNLIVLPNTGGERMVTAIVAGSRVSLPQRAVAATPAPTPAPAPTPPPAPAPTPTPTPAPDPTPAPAPTPAPPPSPSPTPDPAPAPTPAPTPVSEISLEGRVASVSGSCPTVTFVITSQTIFTTAATEFKKMPCKDVKKGAELKVRGWRMSDGTVRADLVEKD